MCSVPMLSGTDLSCYYNPFLALDTIKRESLCIRKHEGERVGTVYVRATHSIYAKVHLFTREG